MEAETDRGLARNQRFARGEAYSKSKQEVFATSDEIHQASPTDGATIVLGGVCGGPPGGQRGTVSFTHLVLIPSFNSGRLLAATVAEARVHWGPVWVVIDGSTDSSAAAVEAMARTDPALRVLYLPRNRGKGAAVWQGLVAARAKGFTHVLVMDADGQHPADSIPVFMATSAATPDALIMGRPVFGADAPWVRVAARRICNWCATLETLREVGDSLFGFRVYPIAALLPVMQAHGGMRRFDFDPEALVRLAWRGVPLIHVPAPVRYLSPVDGGISHFNYLRDNWLLFRMHLRLILTAAVRVPARSLGWAGTRFHHLRSAGHVSGGDVDVAAWTRRRIGRAPGGRT
jgi:hypothetical protein